MCRIGKKVRTYNVPKSKPITGYRGWHSGLAALYNGSFVWSGVGEETRATVEVKPSNQSGLYAFKTESLFHKGVRHKFGSKTTSSNTLYFNPTIHGVVEMWGKVVEHEDGYRASHARIVKIVKGKNKVKEGVVPCA